MKPDVFAAPRRRSPKFCILSLTCASAAKKSTSLLIILPLIVILTACAGSSAPPRQVYYYTLDYAPPASSVDHSLPHVVRVDRFSSSPPYNSQAIIYADKGLHRNAYAHHQWIAPPADLLAFMLARDLQETGAFQAVLPPDSFTAPTHIVNGWLEEFLEKDRPEGWLASLRLSITLLSARETDPSRRILMQRTYRAEAPVGDRTPAGLAEAMSAATARASAEIVQDLYQTLRALKP
jgi:ABC-type uncharacterized transport system auxiliary subunit